MSLSEYKLFKKGETVGKKELVGIVDQLFNTDLNYARAMQDRIVYRNILYYIGEQWIEYIRSVGSFRRRQLPQYIPTPVANEIREFVRSVRAMLLGQNLIPKIRPNTNEKEDIQAASLGEKLLVWMDTINDGEIFEEKEKVSDWLSLAGTAFLRTYPEMTRGEWFFDKKGNLAKTGEVVTKNVIPFNVVMDETGENLRDKRWIGIKTLVPREWAEDTFGVKIGPESLKSVEYQKRLMKLVGQVSPWKGYGNTATEVDEHDLVLFKELELKPSAKYPEGRYIASCGAELLLDVSSMPIPYDKGAWYYTLTDFHYNRVPGKFWSDAGVNDLISPQNRINEIDQALEINRKGMGRPRILTPTELGLKKLSEGGQGFLALKYDPLMSGGKEPRIEAGTPLPQQILDERAVAKEQIQDSSGDPKNILKGKAPSSKASGVMVDILRETAERSHVPDLDRFNRSMSTTYKKRLLLAKKIMTETRMIKAVGKDEATNVIPFKGSDLRDNTDVRLELDSGLSSTMAGKKEILLQLAQYQVINMQDPEMRQEYLKRLGLSGFAEKLNVDIERAERENSRIASGDVSGILVVDEENLDENGEPQVMVDDPLFEYDNHQIHAEVHRKFVLSAEFVQLPEDLQLIALSHIGAHSDIAKAQQQEQLEMQMAMEGKGHEQPNAPEPKKPEPEVI